MNLFAYGTLTFPEVWQRIDVGEFPSEPATLTGYDIFRVTNAVFPGIIKSADPQAQVCGILYYEVDDDALFELDAYESDLYQRLPVTVTTENGPVDCTSYVIPESHRDALTNEVWNPTEFKEKQLAKYLNG